MTNQDEYRIIGKPSRTGWTEGMRCTRGRRLAPTTGGAFSPGKGGIAMVTYSELFQFVIMITGIVGICYQIFGKRK